MMVQYNYLKAYLALYDDKPDLELVSKICVEYIAYPVLFWRNMFVEIANQVAEVQQTEKLDLTDLEDGNRQKSNMESAEDAEFLDAEWSEDPTMISITVRNVKEVIFPINFWTP